MLRGCLYKKLCQITTNFPSFAMQDFHCHREHHLCLLLQTNMMNTVYMIYVVVIHDTGKAETVSFKFNLQPN